MSASMDYVYFPNGCLASYSTDGTSYTALGVLVGDTAATWNYDINEVLFSAGQKKKQYKNQTIDASLTLADINPDALTALSGGMLTKTTTAGSANTDVPDQVIASGAFALNTPVNLVLETSATDSTKLKASAEPTITSVTGSVDGALSEGTGYEIIVDANSFSGYSIVFLTGVDLVQSITIDYASVTPIATTTLTGGSSTYVPDTIALRFYDEASGRTMDIHAANVNSGGFAFGFKASDSDGVEEMALSFTGQLDTTRTSGDQLFSWTLES